MTTYRDLEPIRCPSCGRTWGVFSTYLGRITWRAGWHPRRGRMEYSPPRRARFTNILGKRVDTVYAFRLPMPVLCPCGKENTVDDGFRDG